MTVRVFVPSWWPPKGSSRQFRWEKWFWAATIPPNIALAVVFQRAWGKWGVLYVAFQSAYALVKGAGSQEQAAGAKETAAQIDSNT